MSLLIQLRRRDGSIMGQVEESWASISTMWPDLDPGDYPLLSGVDRDDWTMFNRLQMDRVREELRSLLGSAPDGRASLIRGILDLCASAEADVSPQLWFLGD